MRGVGPSLASHSALVRSVMRRMATNAGVWALEQAADFVREARCITPRPSEVRPRLMAPLYLRFAGAGDASYGLVQCIQHDFHVICEHPSR
jgi:hypothetical protein